MTMTVLAVDDSATMREMLRLTLTDAGFKVHLAEDGQQAVDCFKSRTDIALVLMVSLLSL